MKETVEKTINMVKKLDIKNFDIYFLNSTGFEVEAKSGKAEKIKVPQNKGMAIRVIIDGKLGFAYTTDLSEDGIRITIECAKENAKSSEPDEFEFSIPSENKLDFELSDKSYNDISVEEKIQMAIDLESLAFAFDKRIKRVRKSTYKDTLTTIYYYNSNDHSFHYTTSSFSLSIMLMAEDGNSTQMGWDFEVKRYFKNLNVNEVARTAAKSATELLGGKPIKTCKIPVIFENRVFAEIIEALSPVFLGNNVLRGKSLFADKLGTQIASHILTIYDNPTLADGIGSIPFDDEGTATRKKAIIERGELKHFLLDIYSAKKLGFTPTGNGIKASLSSLPQSGVTNLTIEPGVLSINELIKVPEKVLLITDAMGIHTINPISGEFSIGISGILFKNGEAIQPVTGCTVAGNVKEMLKNTSEVGNDLRWIGNINSPSVLIKELTVSGT